MTSGHWAALHNAPSSTGVAVDRTAGAWQLVTEAAAVTSTHTTLTLGTYPAPTWVDVTAHLIDCAWSKGDPLAESRHPIPQASVRIMADGLISALAAGDPMSNVVTQNDRLGPGCLIRYGYRRVSDGDWRPLFTGYIDTIRESWLPDKVRTFELQCYGTTWALAAYDSPLAIGTGYNAATAWADIVDRAQWPFYSVASMLTPNVAASASPQPVWQLLNQIADTGAAQNVCGNDGVLAALSWSYRSGATPRWYVIDASIAVYSLPSTSVTILPTSIEWVSSTETMLYRANATSINASGTASGLSTSPTLSRRWLNRNDRAGWPKSDLLNSTYAAGGQGEVDNVATRSNHPNRPAVVTFDTQTADRGSQNTLGNLLDFLTDYTEIAQSYQVQRRTAGTAGWFDQLCTVRALDGVITREANQHRLIVSHYLDWWPE
jgi:hypothetical protein